MSHNGIGFTPYLNSMLRHVRLPAQSCRTITVGTRIGTGQGEVALLSFQANAPEAEGVAALVEGLVQREGLSFDDQTVIRRRVQGT